MNACARTATTTVVAITSPIESQEIGRRFARMSRSDEKKAAEYSSGGRNASSTRSGSICTSGMPGMKPTARPPSTSRIGYGIRLA